MNSDHWFSTIVIAASLLTLLIHMTNELRKPDGNRQESRRNRK